MNRSFLNEIMTEASERDVDSSFNNFLHGVKKMKSIQESLDPEALEKELTLFIEGEETLHDQVPSIQKTLFKHWKKGEYSSDLAERAWNRLVSEASQRYAEVVGKEPRLWEQLLPEAVRKAVVEQFESGFYNDLKKGKVNVEELFNE